MLWAMLKCERSMKTNQAKGSVVELKARLCVQSADVDAV